MEGIDMLAQRQSRCKVCVGLIEPGDPMRLFERWGEREREGAHRGCLWFRNSGQEAPQLTWGQLTALYAALRGLPAPEEKLAVRFLGALENKRKVDRNKLAFGKDHDVALPLGPELLEGYRQVLRHLPNIKRTDEQWKPRLANGSTVWTDPDRQAEQQQMDRLQKAIAAGRKIVERRLAIASGQG